MVCGSSRCNCKLWLARDVGRPEGQVRVPAARRLAGGRARGLRQCRSVPELCSPIPHPQPPSTVHLLLTVALHSVRRSRQYPGLHCFLRQTTSWSLLTVSPRPQPSARRAAAAGAVRGSGRPTAEGLQGTAVRGGRKLQPRRVRPNAVALPMPPPSPCRPPLPLRRSFCLHLPCLHARAAHAIFEVQSTTKCG